MSYRIIFKGQIPEEFVEETVGRNLSDAWERNSLPSKVNINGNLYESNSIKAILSGFNNPDGGDKKEEMAEMIREVQREHREGIGQLLALSPEKRAQNTGIAELVFRSQTNAPMSETVRQQIIERQASFFEENPTWAHANPACYRDLIPNHTAGKDFHISNHTALAGLNLVERIVQQGIR